MIQNLTAPTNRNPGIVPPWLQQDEPAKNPGIVPPWLLEPIHTLPVDESDLAVRSIGGDTQFVTESVVASPASFADVLRSR